MVLVGVVMPVAAQDVPSSLRGKWVVKRELPTFSISCWGELEAKKFIGTEIEFTANSFRWNNTTTAHPKVTIEVLSAQQFHDENSGQGAESSQVSFRQLGIRAAQVTKITLDHPPANITGGTIEIPGDTVLLKDKNSIIITVCNAYFEAQRIGVRARTQ